MLRVGFDSILPQSATPCKSASLSHSRNVTAILCNSANQNQCRWKRNVVAASTADSQSNSFIDDPINKIDWDETLLNKIKWDDKGLVVAIAQDVDTGDVLMQAFANRDALVATIESRKATFYSRSRRSLWTKGETSSNFIIIHDIYFDCDRDSIIYLGKPVGPACHTGADTCYFTSVTCLLGQDQGKKSDLVLTTLYSLEAKISQRKAESISPESGKPSWTKRLLMDEKLLCSKIREEANELCQTLEENEDKSRTVSEMADVLYHSMVLLALKDVKIEEVIETLRKRFSKSGIEEKLSRPSN